MSALPIFEPEFSFLPFGCEACGSRFATEGDLALHRRETCTRTKTIDFELPDGRGVHDGGRRT